MKNVLIIVTIFCLTLSAKQALIQYEDGKPYCTYLLSDIDSITFYENEFFKTLSMSVFVRYKKNYINIALNENDSVSFIDLYDGDVTGGMKEIPAKGKTFYMGEVEQGQEVTFTKSFYMDSTEITQKMYDQIMIATYSGHRSLAWGSIKGISNSGWLQGYGHGDTYPAYNVNWYDAVLFCNARSKMAGLDTVYSYAQINGVVGNDCSLTELVIDYNKNGYRLPTEAEWEFACRGGSTTSYYWGKSYDDTLMDKYVWYKDNSGGVTHEVAQKLPNTYGLYDMSGNVFEWCNDWYGPYLQTAQTDPIGPTTGENRVIRGGALNQPYNGLFSYYRVDNPAATNYPTNGFRTVLPIQ